jgi:hypothetical protein
MEVVQLNVHQLPWDAWGCVCYNCKLQCVVVTCRRVKAAEVLLPGAWLAKVGGHGAGIVARTTRFRAARVRLGPGLSPETREHQLVQAIRGDRGGQVTCPRPPQHAAYQTCAARIWGSSSSAPGGTPLLTFAVPAQATMLQ